MLRNPGTSKVLGMNTWEEIRIPVGSVYDNTYRITTLNDRILIILDTVRSKFNVAIIFNTETKMVTSRQRILM